MLNHIAIQGRLVANPELKYTQGGDPYTKFSIAVDASYTKNGEKSTYFFDVTAWRKQAEFACNYLAKGRLVIVEGELTASVYTDRDGIKRKAVDINASKLHFCDSKPKGEEAPPPPPPDFAAGYGPRSAQNNPPAQSAPPAPPAQQYGPAAPPPNTGPDEISDDNYPF